MLIDLATLSNYDYMFQGNSNLYICFFTYLIIFFIKIIQIFLFAYTLPIQSSSFSQPILNFTAVILGGMLTYFTTRSIENHKANLSLVDKKRQIYSQLMGLKISTRQLYGSYIESEIFYLYYLQRRRIEEAADSKNRSVTLISDIVNNNRALFETLGSIRILFPDDSALDKYINEIITSFDYFKDRSLASTEGMNEEQLNKWYDIEKEKLRRDIEDKIEHPIKKLLEHLDILINANLKTSSKQVS